MRMLLGAIETQDREIIEAISTGNELFHAATATELIEGVYACSPDIIIVNRAMPGVWMVLQQISAVLPVPVIVIAAHEEFDADLPTGNMDLFGYLVRPLNGATLRGMIAAACAQFTRVQAARTEVAQLHAAFAARKLIERAKGLIMQSRQVSEADAYSFLRNESRRQRISIAEIAKTLLEESESAPAGKAQKYL
ncbi:MAG TPA: ANTAR domain-containing protein [Armatimonadota bacterium]|jgi:response regulator NasT